jgi:tetratricopeptide (TPR) repeat protein
LNELLTSLASREGLAVITLDDTVPSYVPEAARPAVLTVSEAKGLDFHSVAVLDAGSHIEKIVRDEEWQRGETDLEDLRRRLAIDQLRVALSRPTERLIWLDIKPTDRVVRRSIAFLNGGFAESGVSSSVPSALLKTLEEDEFDLEERVQRCQTDARQFLEPKPEMAWSRAQQAVTLLGRPGSAVAVTDEAARQAAYLTLAEVCFTLGLRDVRVPAELGRPDLFEEAGRAARTARRLGLASIIDAIGRVHRAGVDNRLYALVELAQIVPNHKSEIEPWLLVEIGAKANAWVETLEAALFNGRNAGVLVEVLPPFYEALNLPDSGARAQRLRERAIQLLIKDKQFASALAALRRLPERQPKLEAICQEGLGEFRTAAECYVAAGNLKEALNCYRSVPDLNAAMKLADEIGHPAAESLKWVSRMQELVAQRPEKFTRMMTAAEKKALEELLERALGVARRKPAPRKTAAKTAPGTKKRTVKKIQKSRRGGRTVSAACLVM